ncbi:MAG: DUF2721 domain-containing protein [Planctomycetota bacterium]
MTLTTPALLFPAISLLLLAYTNRFLVLAQLVRQLYANQVNDRSGGGEERNGERRQRVLVGQIANLRRRIGLIKNMQLFGVLSFLACTLAMLALFLGQAAAGEWAFGGSLLLLTTSLLLSVWEIQISCGALNLALSDLEQDRATPSADQP